MKKLLGLSLFISNILAILNKEKPSDLSCSMNCNNIKLLIPIKNFLPFFSIHDDIFTRSYRFKILNEFCSKLMYLFGLIDL